MPAKNTDGFLKRFEQLHPKLIDLSLDRVKRLLAALDNPHQNLPPVVHVAGTNGKGSVVAFMRAILEAAGYGVHTFTSPHLRRFHERITLAGPGGSKPIGEAQLAQIFTRADLANAGLPITFFEITAAAAFLAYSEYPADILLLETGLGGRFDATNVIERPHLSVITPISLDHCSFLGDTVEAIAGEKAGIIKRGRPVIVSRQTDAAMSVIERHAASLEASVIAAGRQFDVFEQQGRLIFQDEDCLLDLPLPRLFGRHQFDNAGTAIAAVRRLKGFKVKDEAIAKGLTTAAWPGRLERLGPGLLYELAPPGSEIWLDGGHNPAAGEVLARALADLEERVPSPLHLIVGMLSTKDAGGFFRPFHGLTELTTTVGIPGEKNAYTPEELAALAHQEGVSASPAENLEAAFARSRRLATGPVRIMITGSLYLAGQVLNIHEGLHRR